MTTHVVSVIACWMIGLVGLVMLVRASTWRGKASAHGAVVLAMLLLSAMALDHKHGGTVEYAPLIGRVKDSEYHAAGCPDLPLEEAEVHWRSHDEAQWAGKKPHVCALLNQAKNHVAQKGK